MAAQQLLLHQGYEGLACAGAQVLLTPLMLLCQPPLQSIRLISTCCTDLAELMAAAWRLEARESAARGMHPPEQQGCE